MSNERGPSDKSKTSDVLLEASAVSRPDVVKVAAARRAIDLVREFNPGSKRFKVKDITEGIKGGEVCYIEFTDDEGDENEVWVWVSPSQAKIFDDVPQLLRFIKVNFGDRFDLLSAFLRILDIGGIAGAIAVVLIGTMAYLSIAKGEILLPELWQSIISSVIAFYFGTKVKNRSA